MAFYTTVTALLCCIYAGIMLVYLYGWRKLEGWRVPEHFVPHTKITVIVPARNERVHIGSCLNSILANDYPPQLLEIIVVDDHSTDDTATIVQSIAHSNRKATIRLLHLSDFIAPGEVLLAHKKKAIESALTVAQGGLIVTTDADCLVPPEWLLLLASLYELRQPKMIAAPVAFYGERNLLQRFQGLDFTGMMGITGAGICLGFQRMGNGANLAYSKSVFEEVNGFEGINNKASGDDMYLLQKVANVYPDGIFFLKNKGATVLTEAQPDLASFVRQRIRWGSKNAAYPEKWVTIVLAAVFFFCWNILACFLLMPFWEWAKWLFFLQIAVKSLFDFIFLRDTSRFFGKQNLMRWFWPSFAIHILYIALVGLASQVFKKYEWKGRRVQ